MSPSAKLGHFDIAALRTFRNMAERHTALALNSIVASGDPTDFIAEQFIQEFIDQAGITWNEGIGVMMTLYGEELSVPLYDVIINEAIVEAANAYRELLGNLISKYAFSEREPIYGEFLRGALVQYGDVRPLLVTLGGGSDDVTVPLMGGITSGHTMSEWLGSNGIETDRKIWLYGYEEEARRTFNGHLQMDGLVFTDWNDDALLVAPQDAWLRTHYYFPGDHFGCACVVAPYVPNRGEDYILDTEAV